MPDRPWCRSRAPRARFGVIVAVALLVIAGVVVSVPAGAQSSAKGVITLTSQDPWVRSSSSPVQLGLIVHSPIAARDLLVHVALYTEPDQSSLASRDEFEATLKGQFAGLNELAPITFSLSSIRSGHGLVDIYVGGSDLSGSIPANTPTDRVFQLPCPARYGGCGGVYPLQVSLQDITTGLSLDSFTTYLIVVPSTIEPQKRLRFSFVVPVGGSVALSPDGAPVVPAKTISQIDNLAREEALSPSVPLTVDLNGQTLLALARSLQHPKLVSKVALGGLDNLVPAPFSNVDPTRLVRAALPSELTAQFLRDDAVFTRVIHLSAAPHVYIATVPVGPLGLATLAGDGITDIVLPQDNLASTSSKQPSSVQWPYTLSAPFQIAGSTVEGVQADAGLAAHLGGISNPVLRAQQLLADLAEIYFDSPGFPHARRRGRHSAVLGPASEIPRCGSAGPRLESHREDGTHHRVLQCCAPGGLPGAALSRVGMLGSSSIPAQPGHLQGIGDPQRGTKGPRGFGRAHLGHPRRLGHNPCSCRRHLAGRDDGTEPAVATVIPGRLCRHDAALSVRTSAFPPVGR